MSLVHSNINNDVILGGKKVEPLEETNENNPDIVINWAGETGRADEEGLDEWDVLRPPPPPPPPPLPMEETQNDEPITTFSGSAPPFYAWNPGFLIDEYNICWDHQKKGWCKRGKKCPWTHVVPFPKFQNSTSLLNDANNGPRPFTGDALPIQRWQPNKQNNKSSWNNQSWKNNNNNNNYYKGNAQPSQMPRYNNKQQNTWSNSWNTNNNWGNFWQQNPKVWNNNNSNHNYNKTEQNEQQVLTDSSHSSGNSTPNQHKYRPRKDKSLKKKPRSDDEEIPPERSPEVKQAAKTAVTEQIGSLLEDPTNFSQADFDFRVRRFLYALQAKNGQQRLEEVVTMIRRFTKNKKREDIKNWSAYILTLLKKFQPDLLVRKRNATTETLKTASEVADAILKILADMQSPGECPFSGKTVNTANLPDYCHDLLQESSTNNATAHILGHAMEHKITESDCSHLARGESPARSQGSASSEKKKKRKSQEGEEKLESTLYSIIQDAQQPEANKTEVALRLFLEILRTRNLCPVFGTQTINADVYHTVEDINEEKFSSLGSEEFDSCSDKKD